LQSNGHGDPPRAIEIGLDNESVPSILQKIRGNVQIWIISAIHPFTRDRRVIKTITVNGETVNVVTDCANGTDADYVLAFDNTPVPCEWVNRGNDPDLYVPPYFLQDGWNGFVV
jgi:hypothetical protein